MFSTTLFGRSLQPRNTDDALELWKFLFDIGVLNARIADDRQKDGYRHVFPHEDPGLVSQARWNDLRLLIWEINPAFRDYLLSKQEENFHRKGLPPRRHARRGRNT